MSLKEAPIGIFDSGIGGTSIWREIHQLLPNENTIYLADSKNAPYGEKSKEEIIALSKKNTELLLSFGCKIIVVACNTATTNAIKILRETYNVPFIGIEPAIKPAALHSKTQTIGILATKGTLSSELFHETASKLNKIKIVEQIGHGLVEQIENGEINSLQTKKLLQKYLQPMIENHVDYIVLGCTHYPYLTNEIRKIIPNTIKIIDSGEAVAKQTKNILQTNNLLNSTNKKGFQHFYTNKNIETLKYFVKETTTIFEKDF